MFNLFRRPPRQPKQIRFIDTDGNTLFLLPDGGSIVITKSSCEQNVKVCRYVDSRVAEIGGTEHNVRLIAVNDGVDSAAGEDDFTPFRNIMKNIHC